ncbi:protein ADM2 [Pempheris klunzingeri]|uniref:protein ADM2 n=1 Tax=Pempheris klunzingeri TaxID=3127111 RepID=UPI00397F1C01
MCALLPAWLCLLLGLLPLEIQSRALTLQSLAHRHRLTSPRTSKYPKSSYTTIMPTASDLSFNSDNHITQGDRRIIWRALLHKEAPVRMSDPLLDQTDNVLPEAPVWQRGSRGRRHANSGGGRGHSHLMRVGCVLGTCQVQNLSHRLYQLIGQSGREDSSPINPRSPHSYG